MKRSIQLFEATFPQSGNNRKTGDYPRERTLEWISRMSAPGQKTKFWDDQRTSAVAPKADILSLMARIGSRDDVMRASAGDGDGDGDAVALSVKQPRLYQAARSATSRKTAL